jgi:riboflavin synthase
MFSGVVEGIGTIAQLARLQGCLHITILPRTDFSDLKIGDSVAVNGVCLTVTQLENNQFSAVIVPETLRLTNLKNLGVNQIVNLERAVKIDTRIGGHYVQGHIDSEAEIIDLRSDGGAALLATFSVPPKTTRYIVKKGYIAIDGMSITIVTVDAGSFTVTFIPHTQAASIVHQYKIGTRVNIEVDIMGKYVEKLLGVEDKCDHT